MVDAVHAGGDVGGLGYDVALLTVFVQAGTKLGGEGLVGWIFWVWAMTWPI